MDCLANLISSLCASKLRLTAFRRQVSVSVFHTLCSLTRQRLQRPSRTDRLSPQHLTDPPEREGERETRRERAMQYYICDCLSVWASRVLYSPALSLILCGSAHALLSKRIRQTSDTLARQPVTSCLQWAADPWRRASRSLWYHTRSSRIGNFELTWLFMSVVGVAAICGRSSTRVRNLHVWGLQA